MINKKKEELQQAVAVFDKKTEKGVEDYFSLFETVVSVTSEGSGLVWSQVEEAIRIALRKETPELHFVDWEIGILRRLISERYNKLANQVHTRNEDVFRQIEAIHERIRTQNVEDVIFLPGELWILKCLVSEKYHEEKEMDPVDINLTRYQQLSEIHHRFEQMNS